MERIRIVEVPSGEAPEEVRRAWVGLILPLAQGETGPRTLHTGGVLTGPRGCLLGWLYVLFGWTKRETGYVVEAKIAIDLLQQKDPTAASWWREHAPHVLLRGYRFVFAATACEEQV